jgi:Uma2 family endonuclease
MSYELPMSRNIKTYITPEEYLALEREVEYKSEYHNGEIFAMTGASRKHNLISTNIVTSLNVQLRGKPCEVYGSDMRLKVTATGLYTYADVVVVCGEPRFEDDYVDTLLNPTLVIEILSKSTERYDRIAKSGYYRTLRSLVEYLLVAQESSRIEQYTRQADEQWVLSETRSLEGLVDLQSIGCSLPLRDVYDKVSAE